MQVKWMIRTLMIFCLIGFMLISSFAQDNPPPTPLPPPGGGGGGQASEALTINEDFEAVDNTYAGIGTVTMGSGELIGDLSVTTDCTSNVRFVASETGLVTADDGSEWIVPMETYDGDAATDIYNDCTGNGDNPDFLDELNTIVVDEDGEVITGYIFADNYFELYINDEFIARDPIGFVPFNSSAVRFQVSYPYTIAVRLADWETHLGLGMEYDVYKVGDGGFIALFSDGAMTNGEWKCQVNYIAPLDDPACVTEDENGNPDSSACSVNPSCSKENPEQCRALHYEVPESWSSPEFDDSLWLNASLYEADEVTNQPGYADYAALFGDAEFIWSQNLDLDNQVICRMTVEAAGG